jgi:hypothetical protein
MCCAIPSIFAIPFIFAIPRIFAIPCICAIPSPDVGLVNGVYGTSLSPPLVVRPWAYSSSHLLIFGDEKISSSK